MFDIGMTELLVIGIVALIVVGPKDLPGMFRTLGRFTGKMRSMAREFQRAMEDAADESGVRDIGKDLKTYSNPKKFGLDKLNEAADSFEKWDPANAPAKKGSAYKRGPEADRAAAKPREDTAATPQDEKSDRIRAAIERAQAREADTAAAEPADRPGAGRGSGE